MGHPAVWMLMVLALAGTVIEDWWCCSVGRVVERRSGVASESASVPPHRVGSKSMPWNCVGPARDDDDVDAGSVPTGIGVYMDMTYGKGSYQLLPLKVSRTGVAPLTET